MLAFAMMASIRHKANATIGTPKKNGSSLFRVGSNGFTRAI
jgi:hypothetical protein